MRLLGNGDKLISTLNPGALVETLEAIREANPDYRLVGSLGRAVLHDLYEDNPYREYDERGERPLQAGNVSTRDLDLINAPNPPALDSPYPLDTVWGHNNTAAVIQDGAGQWRLQSSRHKFDKPLHPAVMAPVTGRTVYGVEAVTVHPQTHLALFAVRGALHHKDEAPLLLLTKLLQKDQPPLPPLPQSLYDPFYDLRAMQQKGLKAMLGRARARLSSK